MIIEKIKHATEKDLQIIVFKRKLGFSVWSEDLKTKYSYDLVKFKSLEAAKHYAEQLAGLIN